MGPNSYREAVAVVVASPPFPRTLNRAFIMAVLLRQSRARGTCVCVGARLISIIPSRARLTCCGAWQMVAAAQRADRPSRHRRRQPWQMAAAAQRADRPYRHRPRRAERTLTANSPSARGWVPLCPLSLWGQRGPPRPVSETPMTHSNLPSFSLWLSSRTHNTPQRNLEHNDGK